ncbi:hypothetical protein ACFTRD_30325 [Paenibacillus sp. NPDC056933]|uniref:hypothetical protein n=1 Tax=Paenibacillus sp. NPDC056933 TaxID=3345968 RepID=UPI00362706F9
MKKRLFSILFSVAMITSLFAGAASANEAPAKEPKAVVNSVKLKPVDGNDDLDVSIQELSDGTVRKVISGSGKADDKPTRYDITINREKNTFTTIETDLSNDPEYSIKPFAPIWSKQVKLLTYDPVGWEICYSKAILYWYMQNDYAIYSNGGSATWAANPSPIDTHWYVDSEQTRRKDKPAAVGQETVANFSNYDFLNDNLYTYVNHNVSVWGFMNGSFDYDAIEDATGEASVLLTSTIEIY